MALVITPRMLAVMSSSAYIALQRLEAMAVDEELGALCERHGIELLVVHGSVVDSAPLRPARDLDLAFQRRHGSETDVIALTNDLLRAVRFDDIDLMDLNRAGPVARARALAPQSLPLYEAGPGAFATAQMAALTTEMETRRLRRLDLELLAS